MMNPAHTTPTRQTTKILTWNANGLLARKMELTQFMNTGKIDIALISETHLTSRSYAEIRNYKLYTCNHPDDAAHGGAALYIRNTIPHHEISPFCTKSIQAAGIATRLHCGTDLVIASVYSPPKHKITSHDYTLFFNHLGGKWIIGGDFNAKHLYWGSRTTTTKGRELWKSSVTANANFLSNGKPTYWPSDSNKIPDCIDFYITRGVSANYTEIRNVDDLSSDHSLIVLTLSNTILRKQTIPKLTNKRTDWDAFREGVSENVNLRARLKTPQELEEAVDTFSSLLQREAKSATPVSTHKIQEYASYPKEILELVKKRRQARHEWQQTRDPAHKKVFNSLCKLVKTHIRNHNNDSFNHFITTLGSTKDTDYTLWKVARSLRKPPGYSAPLKRSNNTWARSDEERAETYAEHLEQTFQPNDLITDIIPDPQPINEQDIKLFSPREIKATIKKKLNPKKAPGHDGISARLLQELPRKGLVMLTYLLNGALRLKHVPKQWKLAKIIMIPKPGKPPEAPSSYRPISLLTVISKLFEKLYIQRLQKIVDEKKMIPDHQFGFRTKHSTVEQVHRVATTIRQALEERKYCPSIFLDVSQAFDRVWIPGLLHKVSKHLPAQHVQILASYLSNRKFYVHYGEANSSIKSITAGVPQGSVLGPLLYLLYTADIPTDKDAMTATFADDTAILTTHEDYSVATTQLQSAVNKIDNWATRWKIKLNASKTVRIDFALRTHGYDPTHIKNEPVVQEESARYLGVHLDSKLNWKTHIMKKREQLQIRFRTLFWMLRAKSRLSIKNKRLLYLMILRPMWMYGIPLWGSAACSNIEIIQRFQNKVLRKITGAPWYFTNRQLHEELAVETVQQIASRATSSYIERLHDHTNTEAIVLLDSPSTQRLRRKPIANII